MISIVNNTGLFTISFRPFITSVSCHLLKPGAYFFPPYFSFHLCACCACDGWAYLERTSAIGQTHLTNEMVVLVMSLRYNEPGTLERLKDITLSACI